MTEVDLMIFDFDGTLVSTATDLANSVNYTLGKLELRQKQQDEIIAFVGDGVRKLIERTLGEKHSDFYPEAMKIFSSYYGDHLLDNTVLYPEVEEILIFYQYKQKVILTNKRYDFVLAISRGLNIEKYFIEIIGDGSTQYKKPDRHLVDYLLHKYNIKRERTVIIGDGINDINLAKNSGILSCAYLNGLGKRDDLLTAHADYYCENILEINKFFY